MYTLIFLLLVAAASAMIVYASKHAREDWERMTLEERETWKKRNFNFYA